jgi:hypothetical protein
MHEKIPTSQVNEEKPCEEKESSRVLDAAKDAGLDTSLLPRSGSDALIRLCGIAKQYSREVHDQMTGRSHDDTHTVRRDLHNQLCIMLFGKSHAEVGTEKVKQARNFAHLLSERDQYVD